MADTISTPADRAGGLRGRISGALVGWRDLFRIVYRDPEHVSERLTLYGAQSLREPSLSWADEVRRARPDTPPAVIADDLRGQSANFARIDGAIAGTPFLLALVPGYLSYLWQEGRMTLRTAALFGRDPGDLRTSAEVLVLRGVHPSVEAGEAALIAARDHPAPEKPAARRRLRTWVHSAHLLLIFGGFMSAPKGEDAEAAKGGRLRALLELLMAAAIWVTTWVLPVTFMIVMAWACESHTRQLGRRALAFYGGEAATAQAAIAAAERRRDRGHDKRAAIRMIALLLSVAVPIAFVAYADHERNTTGVNWVGALGALVAISLVIAGTVLASRR